MKEVLPVVCASVPMEGVLLVESVSPVDEADGWLIVDAELTSVLVCVSFVDGLMD